MAWRLERWPGIADDALVMCRSREQAEAALARRTRPTTATEKNYPTGKPTGQTLRRLQTAVATAPALDPPTWSDGSAGRRRVIATNE